jgi:hypothetical protein
MHAFLLINWALASSPTNRRAASVINGSISAN